MLLRHACSLLALSIAVVVPEGPVAAQQAAIQPVAAELIFENGHILTENGWVTTMAVTRGTIIALGSASDVAPHRSDNTRVIALDGQTVLPGLHDLHLHATSAGLAQMACAIPQESDAVAVLARVRACVAGKPAGQWIVGRGYEPSVFGPGKPDRALLDAIAPNNPVFLTDMSGHSSWANSAALKMAGIDRSTPDPENGVIERDGKGEPTGILRELAARLVAVKVPPATPAQTRAALKWAVDELLAQGITQFEDAAVSEESARAYAELADRGELKQQVVGCLNGNDAGLIARRGLYARSRFLPSCVKMRLDGVPTEARTAAMLDEYVPTGAAGHDHGRSRGILMMDQALLDSETIRFDAQGLTIKFHASGDAAVRAAIDAVAAARRANGNSGLRHTIAHANFVHPQDFAKGRFAMATFEFSPYVWFPSPLTATVTAAVGAERMEHWTPVKGALDVGAETVLGSDWPITPSSNPWIAMETLVTRQYPGGSSGIMGAGERVTLQQAFDLFTRQASRQHHRSHETGSLAAGKLADFIVVNQDIFAVPVTSVHKTKVLMTFIGGEQVYSSR